MRIIANIVMMVKHSRTIRSIYGSFSFTDSENLPSSSADSLSGLIRYKLTVLKMSAPKPKPVMISPLKSPGRYGNQSHA